jgi:hypothetical protein
VTIEVAAVTTTTVMTGDVITRSWRTATMSATYLIRRRQATPMALPAGQEVYQHDHWRPEDCMSRSRYRKDKREIQLIHTKPSQPLCWSEQLITFSRADHWVHIPDPGSYPLVVEPIVEGALLPQTPIDGGSGLNVIFIDTLK